MYKKISFDRKMIIVLSLVSVLIGICAFLIAKILTAAIAFFTNFFWFQKFSFKFVQLVHYQFSAWHIFVPAIGGLIIGLMARYISPLIRGHGIPEVMENILTKESKIPRRMTILRPLSAAISIGSGGPFGAEGPIIGTGSALGSWFGRHFYFTSYERKVLLAVGAAAGMTAIFGTPLAALFIAIELLLFEFSPKSFVPVLIGVSTAYGMRLASGQTHAEFPMGNLQEIITGWNMMFYFFAGVVSGIAAVLLTKLVFLVEEIYEHLPIHWMWWPMIGGIFVGVIGYFEPRVLGVGYANISEALQGKLLITTALSIFFFKYIAWVIALGSGTSGGTLAPLLTFGSSLGVVLGLIGRHFFPEIGILPEVTALVCMSSFFSGATRAVLTSTIFALESTGTHFGIAPLLLGNAAAYLMSMFFLKETIMTANIAKRGVHVPDEYFSVQEGH